MPRLLHRRRGTRFQGLGSRHCGGVHCSASTLTRARRVESPGEASPGCRTMFPDVEVVGQDLSSISPPTRPVGSVLSVLGDLRRLHPAYSSPAGIRAVLVFLSETSGHGQD
ncbi:hypothetical protein NDU88_005275 [Pleurodeles waltl]|uniref:Uncharacterized protein n=1 Tax=Pleurodeles waltl TaxID=8319 RepID=A0AAV7ME53_PLEWA|nr:hypothetical protein NDU88_005275 [Pleurodeles waltl]